MTNASVLQEPVNGLENTPIKPYPQSCPLCGVRATLWRPRVVAGVLCIRYRCWTGHDFSMTAVVDQ
jgi:hypothetical protein